VQLLAVQLLHSASNSLTHFLPSKLCTTYSYALVEVKFEKNEWCHKKLFKKNYASILILFGGNVV
jgi:hypothetical protein